MEKGKSDLSNEKFVTFVNVNLRALRERCPHSKLFWSVFSGIRTEYGEIRISPYYVRMLENMDQNNSEYGHFLHSGDEKYSSD